MRSRRATETPLGCGMVRNQAQHEGVPDLTPDPDLSLAEMWFNGTHNKSINGNQHTFLSEFGRLWLVPGRMPASLSSESAQID